MLLRLSLLVTGIACALGACTDPKGRLDDFANRTIDARVDVTPDASPFNVPDITGTFYIAFAPTPAPSALVQFMWTIKYTKNPNGTGKVKLVSMPLNATTREATSVMHPEVEADVSTGGEFTLVFVDMDIPAVADPVSGSQRKLEMTLNATIKSADLFCGTVTTGQITFPLPLDVTGSTYAAQRVAPGTFGAALPPPISKCPEPMLDAGVADGPVSDGPLPDGPLPDAPTPDATVADAASLDAMM